MNVYFTVDTESSISGAFEHSHRRPLEASRHVFCRIGQESFGIPLLVRIMANFGFRGTYFVETLATRCLGEADTRSIFDFLLREKQDVQLHIHPVFWFYSELQRARSASVEYRIPNPADLIGHLGKEQQMHLLAEAIRYFDAFAGYSPAAFRAGCYAGSRSMMQCLHEFGILIDSSYNPCYHPELSFPDQHLIPNVLQCVEGVWEIPVTVARTKLPEGHKGFKFADCTSLSFAELRTMLDAAAMGGQEHFVIVFHSFSAVKSTDGTYSKMRPNRIVIRRLEKMFQYLSENGDRFQVDTLSNLAKDVETLQSSSPVGVIPDLAIVSSAVRKAVQLVNKVYWI